MTVLRPRIGPVQIVAQFFGKMEKIYSVGCVYCGISAIWESADLQSLRVSEVAKDRDYRSLEYTRSHMDLAQAVNENINFASDTKFG